MVDQMKEAKGGDLIGQGAWTFEKGWSCNFYSVVRVLERQLKTGLAGCMAHLTDQTVEVDG